MASDAINGAAPLQIPTVRPTGPTAPVAPVGPAGAKPAPDASLVSRVGDVLDSARTMLTSPTMAAIAAAAAPFTFGIGTLVSQAIRYWSASSAVKTQAFLEANLSKFSPAGQDTLRKLAAKGVLDMVDPGWNSLRDNLDGYLKAGLDPKGAELVLAQIVNPAQRIAQTTENTCVAATMQIAIATDNPAQYFRMATDMARDGHTQLPDGTRIELSAANQAQIDSRNLPPDERLNARFQAALMAYAAGGYDSATDLASSVVDGATSATEGLRPAQARRLNDALLQMPVLELPGYIEKIKQFMFGGASAPDATQAALIDAVAAAKSGGHGGVMVVVNAGTDEIPLPPALKRHLGKEDWQIPRYHMVLVKDVKDGMVTYLDPVGNTRTESLADFAARTCTDEAAIVGTGTGGANGGGTRGGRP